MHFSLKLVRQTIPSFAHEHGVHYGQKDAFGNYFQNPKYQKSLANYRIRQLPRYIQRTMHESHPVPWTVPRGEQWPGRAEESSLDRGTDMSSTILCLKSIVNPDTSVIAAVSSPRAPSSFNVCSNGVAAGR